MYVIASSPSLLPLSIALEVHLSLATILLPTTVTKYKRKSCQSILHVEKQNHIVGSNKWIFSNSFPIYHHATYILKQGTNTLIYSSNIQNNIGKLSFHIACHVQQGSKVSCQNVTMPPKNTGWFQSIVPLLKCIHQCTFSDGLKESNEHYSRKQIN